MISAPGRQRQEDPYDLLASHCSWFELQVDRDTTLPKNKVESNQVQHLILASGLHTHVDIPTRAHVYTRSHTHTHTLTHPPAWWPWTALVCAFLEMSLFVNFKRQLCWIQQFWLEVFLFHASVASQGFVERWSYSDLVPCMSRFLSQHSYHFFVLLSPLMWCGEAVLWSCLFRVLMPFFLECSLSP